MKVIHLTFIYICNVWFIFVSKRLFSDNFKKQKKTGNFLLG